MALSFELKMKAVETVKKGKKAVEGRQ